jgi:hypothetical protein
VILNCGKSSKMRNFLGGHILFRMRNSNVAGARSLYLPSGFIDEVMNDCI